MATHIHKPSQLTYYIVLDGSNVVTYGQLGEENCLDTPYDTVDTFTDRDSYKSRLLEFGIDIDTPPSNDGFGVPELPDFEL